VNRVPTQKDIDEIVARITVLVKLVGGTSPELKDVRNLYGMLYVHAEQAVYGLLLGALDEAEKKLLNGGSAKTYKITS
jgi:hypothetical protein